MALSKSEKEFIKGDLPYGYISKIAMRAGVSCTSVARYLRGDAPSSNIEKHTLEIYAELKKERSRKKHKINAEF